MIRSIFARLTPATSLLLAGVLGWILASTGSLSAQTSQTPRFSPGLQPAVPVTPEQTTMKVNNTIVDPMLLQTSGCSSCGSSIPYTGWPCNDYGGGGCHDAGCHAGRFCCHGCDTTTWHGRLWGGLYEELCCPDPCYEPRWLATANAAFFQDGPRPVTQTRIRWDRGLNYNFPDTAEWYWAQIGGKGPGTNTPRLRYDELFLYQEIAAKGFSAFVEFGYRSFDPVLGPGASGMGDMNVGAKTVLLDRELLLVTMQFRTFIPTGNFTSGLGTGHVALEPALLAALKLAPTTHLQMQVAEWIPIGGTSGFEGSTFHYHVSLNHLLCHHGNFLSVIGTLEFNGWNFRGGFTDFPSGAVLANDGNTYLNAGPGLRLMFCDRVDFGFAAAFGFGSRHGPDQIYRTEFRMRY